MICFCACLTICSGCVTTATVRDQPRCTVRFADARAAQTFYEAYIIKTYTRSMSPGMVLEVGVPAQPPYEHLEYMTDNVFFNAAIAAADANHDGVISEDEALQYSDRVRSPQAGNVAVARH